MSTKQKYNVLNNIRVGLVFFDPNVNTSFTFFYVFVSEIINKTLLDFEFRHFDAFIEWPVY